MENNRTLTDEEFILARQMKETCCDESGKEVNASKAAEFIHRIGKIYRQRSPHKISLIKSAGLFNAAIVRNPSNISEINSDISNLCQHVLLLTRAKNQNADLVKKAEQVKTSMKKLRKDVEVFLSNSLPKIPSNARSSNLQKLNLDKISAIQKINTRIANIYKATMAEIGLYCENTMGKPPCKYSIVGMGSLARNEITPYSDFEHIILIDNNKNYKSYLEYFKWFSVIFHIIILNMRESIIPSINICSLNDKNSQLGDWYYDAITPRGVSFDGMMPHACKFPLGRQQYTKDKQFTTELIKPVSEMLKYLSSEADLKNGYHLADILTKTCFVCGDEHIFKQFLNGVQVYRNKQSETDIINEVQLQVKDDLNSFSTRYCLNNLQSKDTINIKQLVYRSTTIFVAALAKIWNISANSSFDTINKMARRNKITQNTAYKLKLAIAIACEMRLKVYTEKKSQCDDAIDLKQDGIESFLQIVGEASTINYFQIAYCLQCEVAKVLNFTKIHFYSNLQLINITIGSAFGKNPIKNFPKFPQQMFLDTEKFNFDSCIKQLEDNYISCSYYESFQNKTKMNSESNPLPLNKGAVQLSISKTEQIKFIASYLHLSKKYDDALDFYNQLLEAYRKESNEYYRDDEFAWLNHEIGKCLQQLNQLTNALSYFNRALSIRLSITKSVDADEKIADIHIEIGRIHRILREYDVALNHLTIALKIYLKATINFEMDERVALTHNELGLCHVELQQYDVALHHLNCALQIKQIVFPNATIDNSILWTLEETVRCYCKLDEYEFALIQLNKILKLYKTAINLGNKNGNIAATLCEIGRCHVYMCQYDVALTFFNQALEIYQATDIAGKNSKVASVLLQVGPCFTNMCQYNLALHHLNQALEIYQNTSDTVNKHNVALTLHEIGCCQINRHQYKFALSHLDEALKQKEIVSVDVETDKNIAATLHEIGRCYNDLYCNKSATQFLNRALNIKQRTKINSIDKKSIALTFHEIGRCHNNLCQYNVAINYYKKALEIKRDTTVNVKTDRNIATTLHEIGRCYTNLHQYDSALNHFKQALAIEQHTTLNAKKDRVMATTLHELGRCHTNMRQYKIALNHYYQALAIKQCTTLNAEKDKTIAITLHEIGRCNTNLRQYDDASNHLNRALAIKINATLNADKDKKIALTLHEIGRCKIDSGHYDDALNYLNRALAIKLNTTSNKYKDKSIAITLHELGRCQANLRQYNAALIYLRKTLEIYLEEMVYSYTDDVDILTLNEAGLCQSSLLYQNDVESALYHLKSTFPNKQIANFCVDKKKKLQELFMRLVDVILAWVNMTTELYF